MTKTEQQLIEQRRRLMAGFTCPECGGSGRIAIVHLDGRVEERECHHLKVQRLLQRVLDISNPVSA